MCFHPGESLSALDNAFKKEMARTTLPQVQPMKVIHRVFTLEIEIRYSKSTTKNEVTQCYRPHLQKKFLEITNQ
jgi:hypothetical protein